ncbi:gamma-glutamylcyclotransferase family protein [Bacillus salipaludis]|uniref:gamma-glutamylcyclotransferase family protein n=1 Tax=Bacillus salipaludis TaxID=2547811 RepID=UPI002E1BCCAD|nr:gamma-glutamylcyclotransferase [Bacillus salipaludis]
MEKEHYVFVYGTLRKDDRNHKLLKDAVCIVSHCWTVGKLFDSQKGYPFLVQSKEGKVVGELYLVDHVQLSELDRLEDYYGVGKDNLYNRVEQVIHTGTGDFLAFVYVLPEYKNTKNMQLIESGDWFLYQKN